ncbi:MAG: hypothetical protein WCK09_07540 [Bacteroidota bacterium]
MGSKAIRLNHLQARTAELEKTTEKMNLEGVFAERTRSYLNEFNLFLAHFNAIPILFMKSTLTVKEPTSD